MKFKEGVTTREKSRTLKWVEIYNNLKIGLIMIIVNQKIGYLGWRYSLISIVIWSSIDKKCNGFIKCKW